MFTFITYDMPSADALSTTTVQSYPGSLSVIRNVDTSEGRRMIRLAEQRDEEGHGRVTLLVHDYNDARSGQSVNQQAADFNALLREHPAEADTFVRPLLRDLGQEAVLSPDPAIAWQVFSDRWAPDETVGRKVAALLPAMNDRNYHTREKVVADLQAMGQAGAAVLFRLDRTTLTPEQNLLIDRVLAPYAQLSPREAARLRDDTGFLLDCLYGPDRAIRAAALDRLEKAAGKKLAFDLDAPEADRSAAVAAARAELLRKAPAK